MLKKSLRVSGAMLILLSVFIIALNKQDKTSSTSISNEEIVEIHKQNLSKSPFRESLKLSKAERKAAGIPPNKYFEEEYELTMNPILGRPTFENLDDIRNKIKIMAASKAPGDGIDGNWESRGPDNFGGRTRAVMFDPNDPTNETVFAGGVSGGLWKNTQISNANSAWIRMDIPSNLNISSIAYDPNNTSVFYVGTGESYVNGDVNGDGVWKSEDAGETWTNVFGGISGPTTFESASNITVNNPSEIAGDYISVPTTNFGSTITSVITADLVLANDSSGVPTEGCNALGEDATGKIALIRRGSCNFTVKVKNAQDAGAVGVIVMNNIDGSPIPMGGNDPTITIPAVMISKADGDLIEAALGSGTVNASLNPISGTFTGNLVPGIQHINDIKIKDNAGVSEIYVAAGEAFYKSANAATFLGGPEMGLYKSVDGGASWIELDLPLTTGGNKHEPNDIEIGADGTIWVSTEESAIYGDGGGKIFSSADGVNFSDVFTVPGGERTQIAVSSQNAGTIYVLAEIDGGVSMLRTTDGFAGAPENMALPNDADPGIPANDFTRGQAFYDLLLDVDPSNDQILYAGGIDLFKSLNAGASWSQFSHWFGGYGFQFGGPDQHMTAFAHNNPDRVVFGNDQGVFFSDDGGTTLVERTNGYITTQWYTLGVAPTTAFSGGDYIVGGLQDNGTLIFQGASPGVNSAIRAYGGDGAFSFFDQDGSDQYFIRNFIYNRAINLFDLGTSTNVTINDENSSVGFFINPQALDSNLDILYSNYSSGSSIAIRRYAGIKAQNTIVKTVLSDPELVSSATALTVSPYTTTSSTLLVGTILGDILKVENADTTPTWTNIETGNIIVGSISDLEFGADENEIFATVHNYGVQSIWYTNDGGATWTGKEGDLPDMPVKAIMQSPLNPEEVIIGTELGVWYTQDFSSTSPSWFPAFNGMSNVKVTDIDLRDDNAVFASTYGRGVFSGEFTLDANGDLDGDGVLNGVDNCVNTPNPDQADTDGNGIGDACQDTDGDSILDIDDNCVEVINPDQEDTDGNGIGDACQDTDGDTIPDSEDNCVDTPNPDQEDLNGNGIGDVCDTSYEDPGNITLEVVSESCEGQDNGKISVSMNQTFVNYTATLIGVALNITQPITTGGFTFEDLVVGGYTLCISVDGRDYEQCYEINIDAAESLDGIFSEANDGEDDAVEVTSVTIDTGTPPFSVYFNEEIIRVTNERSFEVETNGSGLLEVKSAKACEGVMSRYIEDPGTFQLTASPNPVINELKISFSNNDNESVPVQVYDMNGKLLMNDTFIVQNSSFIKVPFGRFNNGIYFVRLNINEPEVLKIIKR